MTETDIISNPDYERGRMDATLLAHAEHLAAINGSVERFAVALEDQTTAFKLYVQQAESDRAISLAVANAVRDAEKARRIKLAARWTPFTTVIVIIGSLATIGSLLAVFLVH